MQGTGSGHARAAVASLTSLLEALESVLQPAQYLQGLVQLLSESQQDTLIPRIMRLYEVSLLKTKEPGAVLKAMQLCPQVSTLLFHVQEANVPQSKSGNFFTSLCMAMFTVCLLCLKNPVMLQNAYRQHNQKILSKAEKELPATQTVST